MYLLCLPDNFTHENFVSLINHHLIYDIILQFIDMSTTMIDYSW